MNIVLNMNLERKDLCLIKLLLICILGSSQFVVVYSANTNSTNSKEGSCPIISRGTVGTCVESCSDDMDCKGVQKCCTNGCGHVCSDPVLNNISCPAINSTSAGICIDECSDKDPCGHNQICCPNGCGHVCMEWKPIETNGLSHRKAGDWESQESGGRFTYASSLVILLFGFVVTATITAD